MLEDKGFSPTPLSKIGEFGLIETFKASIKNTRKNTIKGIGDDAAVLKNGKKYTLISTDMLVEGVHFDFIYTPLKHLGYKAVAVNLSDIYAMNGTPTHITVNLAINAKMSVEAIDELYLGIMAACEKYNVDIIGGDTTSSLAENIISITVFGETSKDKITYRNTAQENDLICVTGDLGAAYMGLQLLEREKAVFAKTQQAQPDFDGFDYILQRFLKPEPRFDIIDFFSKKNIVPTSMIDISDGLSSEIIHLGYASQKGMVIYESKLPIDPQTVTAAEMFKINPTVCALNGGEDYELLFTVNQNDFDKIKTNNNIHIIGHVTANKGQYQMVGNGDSIIELTAQGWNAFLNKQQ
jgi:thiamine-monophosphate kinase